jgi:hypothetical protein
MLELYGRDYELGLEWQPYKAFEVNNLGYADRTLKIVHLKQQATRNLLRLQAQFNFLRDI